MNWKFWKKPDAVPNPRDKKRRGDPVWVMNLTLFVRMLNVATGSLIFVALLMWGMLQV